MAWDFLHSWCSHWPSNWRSIRISFWRSCWCCSFRLLRPRRSPIELRLNGSRSRRSWLESWRLWRMMHHLFLLNRLRITLITSCGHDRRSLISCWRIHLLRCLRRSKSLRFHLRSLCNRVGLRRRSFSLSRNFSHCLHVSSRTLFNHYRLETVLHRRVRSCLVDLLYRLRWIVPSILIDFRWSLRLNWSRLSKFILIKNWRSWLSLVKLRYLVLFGLKHRRIIPVYRVLIIFISKVLNRLFLWRWGILINCLFHLLAKLIMRLVILGNLMLELVSKCSRSLLLLSVILGLYEYFLLNDSCFDLSCLKWYFWSRTLNFSLVCTHEDSMSNKSCFFIWIPMHMQVFQDLGCSSLFSQNFTNLSNQMGSFRNFFFNSTCRSQIAELFKEIEQNCFFNLWLFGN